MMMPPFIALCSHWTGSYDRTLIELEPFTCLPVHMRLGLRISVQPTNRDVFSQSRVSICGCSLMYPNGFQPMTNCSIKLLQTLITFYTRLCRRHPMHPNTAVSDNAHIHCSCLHIPLTSLTVILLHAWCIKTVISTSHFISSVLFIYMYWLAFCHAIQ